MVLLPSLGYFLAACNKTYRGHSPALVNSHPNTKLTEQLLGGNLLDHEGWKVGNRTQKKGLQPCKTKTKSTELTKQIGEV